MIRGLQYYGGKSATGIQGMGRWVASHLPQERTVHYVEPFCGMAGVLLSRQPANKETLNDANGAVVNWWRAVRDAGATFGDMLEKTPHSRAEFDWACEFVRSNSPPRDEVCLKHALAAHILISQSFNSGCSPMGTWAYDIAPSGVAGHRSFRKASIDRIARRIRNVQLEARDACDILYMVADEKKAVVYCDPPYRTTKLSGYRGVSDGTDWDRMLDLLRSQKGRVAISGTGDEWNHLGWRCEEKTIRVAMGNDRQSLRINPYRPNRIERLWMNFDAGVPPIVGMMEGRAP